MNFSIRFHQVMQSSKVFDLVEHEVRKIESRYPDIISCAAVIDKPHNRHRKGNLIRAQLTLSFPGRRLVVSKSADDGNESDSALAALSYAFEAAEYTINGHTHKQHEYNRKGGRFQLEAIPVGVQ